MLDEPTTGLDVEGRDALWAGLRRYREAGGTLVVTSHYLGEIEAVASRVVVLNRGAVVADGSVDSVRSRVHLARVSLRTEACEAELAALPGVVSVDRVGSAHDAVTVLANREPDAFVTALVRRGIDFRRLEVRAASLEEAFPLLTAEGDAPPDRAPRYARDPSTRSDR